MIAFPVVVYYIEILSDVFRMNNFRYKKMSFIQSELALNPNLSIHNLAEQLNSIWYFLRFRGQIGNDANASLMILSFSDNDGDIVFMEAKVLIVFKILIRGLWNLFSQILKIVANIFVSWFSSKEIKCMISVLIDIFWRMGFPSIVGGALEFVLIMSWRDFYFCPEHVAFGTKDHFTSKFPPVPGTKES